MTLRFFAAFSWRDVYQVRANWVEKLGPKIHKSYKIRFYIRVHSFGRISRKKLNHHLLFLNQEALSEKVSSTCYRVLLFLIFKFDKKVAQEKLST